MKLLRKAKRVQLPQGPYISSLPCRELMNATTLFIKDFFRRNLLPCVPYQLSLLLEIMLSIGSRSFLNFRLFFLYNRPDRSEWCMIDRDLPDKALFRAIGLIRWQPSVRAWVIDPSPTISICLIKVHSVTVPTCLVVQGLHGLRAKPKESTDFAGGDVSLKKNAVFSSHRRRWLGARNCTTFLPRRFHRLIFRLNFPGMRFP